MSKKERVMNETLKISVNIAVYNTARYLPQLIASIQNQTFKDFEVIFVDDGSTDNSVEIIKSYADLRFKVIELRSNRGVASARNIAVAKSSGTYIAICDSDDVMHPQWLEKQFNFMELHPDVDVCGVWYRMFGDSHLIVKTFEHHDEIYDTMFFVQEVAHGGAIIRVSTYKKYAFKYNESLSAAEDFDLWSQMLGKVKFHNLQEVLFYYRRHSQQISTDKLEQQDTNADRVRANNLKKIDVDFNDKDLEKYLLIITNNFLVQSLEDLSKLHEILTVIGKQGLKFGFGATFEKRLLGFWQYCFWNHAHESLRYWVAFYCSPYYNKMDVSRRVKLRIFLRAVKWSVIRKKRV